MELVSDEPELDSVLDEYVVPKGLDRLDQVALPLDQEYTFRHTGKRVTAYILDTGIAASHTEFQGRARCGFDATSQEPNCFDAFNHGTHVAATVGGTTTGVAKLVDIVSVKVIANNGGKSSLILAGIDYVMQQKNFNPDQPMVVNMSLGGFYSASVNQAVDQLVAAGVVVVAAAGNRDINACLISPASATGAITVGASAIAEYLFRNRDRRALYSNHGHCVDIFAYVNCCCITLITPDFK
jgi:subtilisin family serine protease